MFLSPRNVAKPKWTHCAAVSSHSDFCGFFLDCNLSAHMVLTRLRNPLLAAPTPRCLQPSRCHRKATPTLVTAAATTVTTVVCTRCKTLINNFSIHFVYFQVANSIPYPFSKFPWFLQLGFCSLHFRFKIWVNQKRTMLNTLHLLYKSLILAIKSWYRIFLT